MIERAGAQAASEVRVEFTPTADDHVLASRQVGGGFGRMLAIAGLIAVVGLVAEAVMGERSLVRTAVPWLLIAALWAGLFTWGMGAMTRRQWRNSPHLHGTYRHVISDAGVRLEAPTSTTELRWSAILRSREAETYFLLYYTARCAYFVPKREMDAGQAESLRAILARNVQHHADFAEPRGRS